MSDTEPEFFDLESMTRTEKKIWLMAYTVNQPQPSKDHFGGRCFSSALYWACCAVYYFRGVNRTPSNQECLLMFEHMRKTSK